MSAFTPTWSVDSSVALVQYDKIKLDDRPLWGVRVIRTIPKGAKQRVGDFARRTARNAPDDVEVLFFEENNEAALLPPNEMPPVFVDKHWYDTVLHSLYGDGPTWADFAIDGKCAFLISAGIFSGLLYFNPATRSFPTPLGPFELGPPGVHSPFAGHTLERVTMGFIPTPIWCLKGIQNDHVYRDHRTVTFTTSRRERRSPDDVEVRFADRNKILCRCHMQCFVDREWYESTVIPLTARAPTFEELAPDKVFAIPIRTGISLGLLYWNGDPEDYPNAYGPQGVPTVVDPNHVHDE